MAIANWTCVSCVAYAPGNIAVNVTWIEREFNACKTHRTMYTPIFNRLRAIARYWSEIATFCYPLHLTPPYGVAPGTIAVMSHCWKEDSMQYIYCNTFTAIVRGPYTGRPKCAKNVLKWRIFKLPVWITGKRLKIDGYIRPAYIYYVLQHSWRT